jgi:homopolymeric O-antigen transport system ATP-binding protein
MAAVQNLCSNCILLERGRVEYMGPSYQAISRYYNEESAGSTGQPQTIQALRTHRGRQPGMEVTTQEAWLTSDTINPVTDVAMGRPVGIHIRFHSHSAVVPTLGVVVKAVDGMPLFGLNNRMLRESRPIPALTQGVISMHMKSLPLMPGRYMIDLYFGNNRRDTDIILNAISLNVTPGDVYGTGSLPPASAGPMYVMACFRIEASEVTVSYSANVQQSMV